MEKDPDDHGALLDADQRLAYLMNWRLKTLKFAAAGC